MWTAWRTNRRTRLLALYQREQLAEQVDVRSRTLFIKPRLNIVGKACCIITGLCLSRYV